MDTPNLHKRTQITMPQQPVIITDTTMFNKHSTDEEDFHIVGSAKRKKLGDDAVNSQEDPVDVEALFDEFTSSSSSNPELAALLCTEEATETMYLENADFELQQAFKIYKEDQF
ncbi:unnamed protein product [Mucor hiemalis]